MNSYRIHDSLPCQWKQVRECQRVSGSHSNFAFVLGDLLSFLAPPMDKEKLREEILESIYEDYADREVLPHYGMIPDWYLRYKDLSKLVIEYLNTP